MPRKTTGSTTTRSKKTETSTKPVPVQAMPEVPVSAAYPTEVKAEVKAAEIKTNQVRPIEVRPTEVATEPKTEIKVSKSGNGATAKVAGNGRSGSTRVNLEEAIRVRAYELYLQRRATAGQMYGDPNQDWLVAEREILSHFDGQGHHTA